MITMNPLTLAAEAERQLDSFRACIAGIPYERKGILYSEMLFFSICARAASPRRILESGRARGQSTLILARCFPDLDILSVEYDRNSPDVPVAAERLKDCPKVQQLFGDATQLLPSMTQPGDVALIDGPKGHRGLRLAISLLATGKVPMVFVHDTAHGTPERRFLETHFPETIFSDEAVIASVTHQLDAEAGDDIPAENRFHNGPPSAGYGFSLACIPYRPRNYRLILALAVWDGVIHRLFRRK